jgi:DNA mismatch repair ATPase MutS
VPIPYCGPHLSIITGPSMGGKSTFMRSVGLAVVLAQIGMYIPAAAARLPVFTHLFSRSAAVDDPMAGLSTFTAEMVELSSLLHNVTPTSLVLLDEVGRGTSTREGFGIAAAVGEHLRDRVRCITLMATHFYALSSLADPPQHCWKSGSSRPESDASAVSDCSEAAAPRTSSAPPPVQRIGAPSQLPRPCVIPAPHQPAINLHAEAFVDPAQGRLQLLYDMRPGASDKALGLEIAELCGLPGEVVAAARADLHPSNGKCKNAVPDSAL